MLNVVISNHANKRIKQRVGIKSFNAQVGYVEKAYKQGLRKEDCTGASLRLLEEREEFSNDRDLVLFRDQIFVFDGLTLVTVLPIDQDYQKLMNKVRCKRNKRIA